MAGDVTDRRQPLQSTAVAVVHIIFLVFGWIVFFAFWAKVLWRDSQTAQDAGLLIVIGLLATPLITLLWVIHNKLIFRRKGARGAGYAPPEAYENDWSGRTVFAEWSLLKTMRNVEVIPSETAKLYKPFRHISQPASRPR